mgnify:FL=1
MTSKSFALPGQPCPNCRKNFLSLAESVEQVEHFGPVLLTTISCSQCGYKDTDVSSIHAREPSVMRARITSGKDLSIKVIRSKYAIIRIPELGVSISPRTAAEGFITNVEGVLVKIQQVLEGITPSLSKQKRRRAKATLTKLKKAREGKLGFVVELKDPSGVSAIVGSDTTKMTRRLLTKKELEKLRKQLPTLLEVGSRPR